MTSYKYLGGGGGGFCHPHSNKRRGGGGGGGGASVLCSRKRGACVREAYVRGLMSVHHLLGGQSSSRAVF